MKERRKKKTQWNPFCLLVAFTNGFFLGKKGARKGTQGKMRKATIIYFNPNSKKNLALVNKHTIQLDGGGGLMNVS